MKPISNLRKTEKYWGNGFRKLAEGIDLKYFMDTP